MKKKNLLSLVLVPALLLTLAACGGKTQSDSVSDAVSVSSVSSKAATSQPDGLTTGGSDLKSAQSIPLDTKLKGKTAVQEAQWYSFTTDETENATYAITSVNQTQGTGSLRLIVCDEEENQLHRYTLDAEQNGTAATLQLDLMPETTYYMKVWANEGDVISYSVIIRSPQGQQPENNLAQPGPEAKEGLEIFAATNQDDAQLVPLNARMEGKVKGEERQWYAFATNSAENATYRLTSVNMTRGTGNLNLNVFDQYGQGMNRYTLKAGQDGKAATLDLELPPDTTYYFYLTAESGDAIQYSLTIQTPEEGAAQS